MRGTGYIITNSVNNVNRVTWDQLQEIYTTGWTVGNHTASHTNLTTLSLSGQEAELLGARDASIRSRNDECKLCSLSVW